MSTEYTYSAQDVRCPYCEIEQPDSWELGRRGMENCGTMECCECGKLFEWEREISVAYYGKPMEDKTNE